MNTVTFERRDFAGPRLAPGLVVEVERMSWRAVGGPWKARLKVRAADATRLWQAAELLRCGVRICDDLGPAWWGYVSKVSMHWNSADVETGLEALGNDVMVRYKTLSPDPWGGEDAFTARAMDAVSIAEYGRRQQVYALGPATTAQAEAFRAAQLARFARPFFAAAAEQEVPAGEDAALTAGGSYAIIECRGWWETLDWMFYADNRGFEGNRQLGSSLPLTTQLQAQSFPAGAEGWTATEIWLRVGKEGNPPGTGLYVALLGGTVTVPGAVLADCNKLAANIPAERSWVRFVLSVPVALAAVNTYWVYIQANANGNADNYYHLSLDENQGYLAGVLRWFRPGDTSWVDVTPGCDVTFMVRGTVSQDSILARMLSTCGQFFAGVRMESTIGFDSIAYRDGRERGRAEVEAVLSQGTSAAKRLLCRVEADRWLRVFTQPDGATPDLVIGAGGVLSWRDGRRLHCAEQAAGRWARLGLESGAGAASGTGAVFVESCAWDAERGLRLSDE